MPTDFDLFAFLAVVIFLAAVITAVKVLVGVGKKLLNFTDLLQRELTGWTDPATGEKHPSLRSELKDAHDRLCFVEEATKQLTPNSGSHIADVVRDMSQRLKRVEERIDVVHPEVPKPRTRRTTRKKEDQS